MCKHILVIFMVMASTLSSGAPLAIVLDCPVTKVSPIFDFADFPLGAAIVRMEHYRFSIPIGGGVGLATTPRVNGTSSYVVESDTQFQIDFENKRLIIDRMTGEFQVSVQGAEQPFGGGACTRIEKRKF